MRKRLSGKFANVTSMLALFVALSGTSYAAYNSVGKGDIRANAVGKSEVRSSAIGASEVRSSAIRAARSPRTPSALGGARMLDRPDRARRRRPRCRRSVRRGPHELTEANGVTFHAAVNADGAKVAGDGTPSRTALGVYSVELGRDVGACQYSATLAGSKTGTTIDPAIPGVITAEPAAEATKVTVETYDNAATTPAAADRPFHLLVAC